MHKAYLSMLLCDSSMFFYGDSVVAANVYRNCTAFKNTVQGLLDSRICFVDIIRNYRNVAKVCALESSHNVDAHCNIVRLYHCRDVSYTVRTKSCACSERSGGIERYTNDSEIQSLC